MKNKTAEVKSMPKNGNGDIEYHVPMFGVKLTGTTAMPIDIAYKLAAYLNSQKPNRYYWVSIE